MKKLALALALVLSSVAASSVAASNGWFKAQTKRVLADCIDAADGPNDGFVIEYTVSTVSACFAGGFLTEVDVWRAVDCPPNGYCIALAPELVGTAQFGCDDQLLWAECADGCPTATDDFVSYGGSVEECAVIRFACDEGYEPYFGDCGCGCVAY